MWFGQKCQTSNTCTYSLPSLLENQLSLFKVCKLKDLSQKPWNTDKIEVEKRGFYPGKWMRLIMSPIIFNRVRSGIKDDHKRRFIFSCLP